MKLKIALLAGAAVLVAGAAQAGQLNLTFVDPSAPTTPETGTAFGNIQTEVNDNDSRIDTLTGDAATVGSVQNTVETAIGAAGIVSQTDITNQITTATTDMATNASVDTKITAATTDMATNAGVDTKITDAIGAAGIVSQTDITNQITTATTDMATNASVDTKITAATTDMATNASVDTKIAAVNTTIGDIDDLTSTQYFTGVVGEEAAAAAPENITASLVEADKRLQAAFAAVGTNTEQTNKNTAAIKENTGRIVALEEDVETLKGGVAMAIAMANAPVIQGGANGFSLSGGFGYYDGASAASVKAAFMPTDNIAITASVASDFGDEFAVGGGVGFAF